MRDALGVARPRLLRHQHQQRHDHGAAPIRDLVEVERKPFRQQHDLDRHHRHGAPRHEAEQRQQDAREHVGALGAAARAGSPRARGACDRRVDGVADHLQREIGLHRRADVESAVVEQRPAAVRALDAAQIDGDLGFERRIDRLAEIMPQQHIFGREWWRRPRARTPNGRPARWLRQQRLRRLLRCAVRAHRRARRASVGSSVVRRSIVLRSWRLAMMSAARLPERIAPSMVAGRPVSVQSPARTRLRHAVARAGPLGVLRRRRGESGAPLAHDLPGRQFGRQSGHARDLAPDRLRQFLARRVDQPIAGADGDRQPAGKGKHPFAPCR